MSALRVGVISDTHGLLRPEARAFAGGCDYIIHGGEIRVEGTKVKARTLELVEQ